MKKTILLLIAAIFAFNASALSSYFYTMVNSIKGQSDVTEVTVTKSMLNMLSDDVREKVPLLETVRGLESISIFALSHANRVRFVKELLNHEFFYRSKNATNLLTLDDGNESIQIWGVPAYTEINDGEETKVYKEVVMFTTKAPNSGKLIIFTGRITADDLAKIGKTASGM